MTVGTEKASRWGRLGAKVMIVGGAVVLTSGLFTANALAAMFGVAAIAIGAVRLVK